MASSLYSMFMCAIKYGENEQMPLHERPPHMHRDVYLFSEICKFSFVDSYYIH